MTLPASRRPGPDPRPDPGARPGAAVARSADVRAGVLFAVGSLCFALGSLPAFFGRVPALVVAWTFALGAVAFTWAATVQHVETVRAATAPHAPAPAGHDLLGRPRGPDRWAAAVQLVGTLCFNVSTLAATRMDLTTAQERRLVWAPDVYGSVCFLVASTIAWVVARRAATAGRGTGWWIAVANLAGSVAFGAAAVGARLVGPDGAEADVALVNTGTFVGAVLFLVAGVLLARPRPGRARAG